MEQINLIIADDHDIFRDGLKQQFNLNERFNVVDSCRDGEHLLRSVFQHRPDVVLIDLRMPVMSGIEAIKRMAQEFPEIRILVLSSYDSELMIEEALQAGAVSYVTKSMPRETLFEAIESTYRNVPFYCNVTAHKLRRIINANRTATGSVTSPNFNSTELVIIRMTCEDKKTSVIAAEMLLGKRTIDKYRTEIYKKMNVNTPAGVAVYAIRHGLYHPEE